MASENQKLNTALHEARTDAEARVATAKALSRMNVAQHPQQKSQPKTNDFVLDHEWLYKEDPFFNNTDGTPNYTEHTYKAQTKYGTISIDMPSATGNAPDDNYEQKIKSLYETTINNSRSYGCQGDEEFKKQVKEIAKLAKLPYQDADGKWTYDGSVISYRTEESAKRSMEYRISSSVLDYCKNTVVLAEITANKDKLPNSAEMINKLNETIKRNREQLNRYGIEVKNNKFVKATAINTQRQTNRGTSR